MKKFHLLWGKARHYEYDKDIKRKWGDLERELGEFFDAVEKGRDRGT